VKLRFVQHTFMAVCDVLRPVPASWAVGRQRFRDRVDSWANMVIAPVRQNRHAIARCKFVFEHSFLPNVYPPLHSARLQVDGRDLALLPPFQIVADRLTFA
jgi:hypothetical protein